MRKQILPVVERMEKIDNDVRRMDKILKRYKMFMCAHIIGTSVSITFGKSGNGEKGSSVYFAGYSSKDRTLKHFCRDERTEQIKRLIQIFIDPEVTEVVL